MHSTLLYNISTAGYIASLAVFAVHVVNAKKLLLRLGVLAVAASFLIQTGGMLLRWMEAGFLEVSAAERAVSQKLFGWSWFVVFSQHPPWSNLYEIMVYMSWGLILVTLAAEMRWQLAWLRQIGLLLALLSLGMASLTDPSIKPLVPALKSWWIMIHVISASIAYGAGSLAAFISLFALMKDSKRVSARSFFGISLLSVALMLLALGGGFRLLLEQSYFVKLLAKAGDNVVTVMDSSVENGVPFLVPMPGMGALLCLAIAIHLAVGFLIILGFVQKKLLFKLLNVIAFLSTSACLVLAIYIGLKQPLSSVQGEVLNHLWPLGPWHLGFKSHPWAFGLLSMTFLVESFVLWFLFKPQFIREKMASVDALESAAYKAISLAFFLMSIVFITGALWAHYAWGRYWAWDPKETGALAIWILYAIFLHTKRTPGLEGPFSSMLGIVGFFVIIIGFLGVNLGLFADGLHTYGNS